MKPRIRLRGMNEPVAGKTWEADALLRAGRQANFEILLDDTSVSRRHAEVRSTSEGWQVCDLGSTNGTFVNGVRLLPATGKKVLKPHDVIHFGKVAIAVDALEHQVVPADDAPSDQLLVQASTSSSWEDAMSGVGLDFNRSLRPGEQLQALLRAGRHLVQIESEEQLLHSILNDSVSVLDAQRGAIVLADELTGDLKLRALATGQRAQAPGRFSYSKHLAERAYNRTESIMYSSLSDPELATAQSIADGAMASALCVLLRTPRRKLGILHLDRNHWQKPFTKDDLGLADALAAHVSAGIECALLMKKQRELFYNTITLLAQAVELRDPYTGNHTIRVTNYSLLLAERVQLSPQDRNLVRYGTPLHDVGKIGIDDAILRKPDKLTPEEFEIMKTHTTKGATILGNSPDLAPIIPIVRNHHERWDGKGYPDRLVGAAIPFLARIVAVADAFDAMTSDRPYRKGMPADQAFAEVEKMTGKQFDPDCAAAFLDIRDRIMDEMTAQRTTILPADPI